MRTSARELGDLRGEHWNLPSGLPATRARTATAEQPHCADEPGRLAVLEQQAGRAGPERGEDPSVGLRRRQQHHGDGGSGEDPPRDFDTAESGNLTSSSTTAAFSVVVGRTRCFASAGIGTFL